MWHGTKGAVAKTTVLTSMKPPSHVTEVANPVKPGVVPLNVRGLPSQRGKARKFASFGSREDVIGELSANSFMRVRLVSQDKPLLPVRLVVKTKIKRSMPRTQKERDPEALRAQSPQSPKDLGPA